MASRRLLLVEDSLTMRPPVLHEGRNTALLLSAVDRDKAALVRIDLTNGKQTVVGQSDKADQVQAQIDATTDAVRGKWRSTKDQYLEVCNQKMVGKYVTAALIARKDNVKDA